ncbi:hypothetical protein JXA48_00075 [Candidatus Woesearchaeota archaeon]|nr:hypothetical protein [Candidatus Woesearchaeota archaeon]
MREDNYGYGITFVDIDETLFHTSAKVIVKKDNKKIKELSNQEFNNYILKSGEELDFSEFVDSKLFYETSEPIKSIINQVKNIIRGIETTESKSKIILLTARKDLENKELFLQTFRDQGIDIDNKEVIYIERAGNISGMSIAQKKRIIIMKYLKQGIFRRCRLIDDSKENIREFLKLARNVPSEIEEAVRKKYEISSEERAIHFYGLLVLPDGKLEPVTHV